MSVPSLQPGLAFTLISQSGSYNLATTSMAEKETWIKDFYWVRANSSNKRIDLTLEKEKEKISKKSKTLHILI